MTKLSIPEMSCNHCMATVEKTVKSLDPAAVLSFDMTARTVELNTTAALSLVKTALSSAGYEATAA
jgi:copper chaperone